MAAVVFSLKNLASLIQLNIGFAERFDERHIESFTLIYMRLIGLKHDIEPLEIASIMRETDAFALHDRHLFMTLPFTDKYGAVVVKNMLEEMINEPIASIEVSFPSDGDTPSEMLQSIQAQSIQRFNEALEFLDPFIIKQ